MNSEVMLLRDGIFSGPKSPPFLPDSPGTSSRMPPLVCLEGSQAL